MNIKFIWEYFVTTYSDVCDHCWLWKIMRGGLMENYSDKHIFLKLNNTIDFTLTFIETFWTEFLKSINRKLNKELNIVFLFSVAVVVAFFVCWAPFHIQRLYSIYQQPSKETLFWHLKMYELVTYVSGILYYMSATINPILYNIMSIKFREAFKVSISNE